MSLEYKVPLQGISIVEPMQPNRVSDVITVIIPTIGRPILQKCLLAIAGGTVLPHCVIVVDQGEGGGRSVTDWLADLGNRGLSTLRLPSTAKNPSVARNLALSHVQTPLVAAVDDDCIPDEHWLEAMLNQLGQHPDFIITGRVDPAGGGNAPTIVSSSAPRLYSKPSFRFPSPLTTGNMGVALRTAQSIGTFDELLFTAEDNDWAYRALRAGIPILYAPDAIVSHFHWRAKSELASTYLDYAWGQGNFYGKHLRRGDLLMLPMAGISLFRGARDLLFGILSHDNSRRLSGSARMKRLIPGTLHGLLRSDRHP